MVTFYPVSSVFYIQPTSIMYVSHLAQGETGRLGLESPELGPLLRGDVLGHEGVRGLDVGEGRGFALKWLLERVSITATSFNDASKIYSTIHPLCHKVLLRLSLKVAGVCLGSR